MTLPTWATIADLAAEVRADPAELALIAERLNVDLVDMPGGKRLSPAAQLAVVVAWCRDRAGVLDEILTIARRIERRLSKDLP